jgi:hypothetical protein
MPAGVPAAEALAVSFLDQGLWVGVTSTFGLVALAWEAAGRLLMLITGKQIDNLPEA